MTAVNRSFASRSNTSLTAWTEVVWMKWRARDEFLHSHIEAHHSGNGGTRVPRVKFGVAPNFVGRLHPGFDLARTNRIKPNGCFRRDAGNHRRDACATCLFSPPGRPAVIPFFRHP